MTTEPRKEVVAGWTIEWWPSTLHTVHITGPKPRSQDAVIDEVGDLVLDVREDERGTHGDAAGSRWIPVVVVEAAIRMWRETIDP